MATIMQQMLTNEYNQPNILGSGLCAYAVKSIWKNGIVYSSTRKKHHDVISSFWRKSPIISNSGWKGLSKFYHGVMPSEVLEIPEYKEALKVLGLSNSLANSGFESYFVPRRTPRSQIVKSSKIRQLNECQIDETLSYFCLSVTGNIRYLIDNSFLDNALLSDDIVFRLGNISTDEFSALMPKRLINAAGCHFPCKNFAGVQVSFRPVFEREVNMNFIDAKENLRSDVSVLDLVEKIRRAIFLRYGLSLGGIRYWECYVQKNLETAYHCTRDGVTENLINQQEIKLCIEKVCEDLFEAGFKSLKKNVGDFLSGVHLGYDRDILSDLPSNYRIFDTSLNSVAGAHPTIRSFCECYKLAYEDFLDSEGFDREPLI
jgi:hypothetical protein